MAAPTPPAADAPLIPPASAAGPTLQPEDGSPPARPRKKRRPTIPALERDYQKTILGAARVLGWRTAHFRPGRTAHGWRTAVEGDGKGFPDLLLIHPRAGFVWFVELKRDDNPRLSPDQEAWHHDLVAAGAVARIVTVPSGLQPFLDDMADATRTRTRAKRVMS